MISDEQKKLYENLGAQLEELDRVNDERKLVLQTIARTRRALGIASNAVKTDVT
jgi:hypothetical protein